MIASTTITAIFVLTYFAAAIYLLQGLKLDARSLCACGLMTALTVVLECFYIPLPTGSSISLCSPVPLLLLALLWDKRLAIVSGWVCGILVMLFVPLWQPVHWGQFFVEHMIGFSCLGLAAVFGTQNKWRLLAGLVLASAVKLCAHILSGVLFFSQNAWDGWSAWSYSISYNLSGILPLCILSGVLVLLLPLKTIANSLGKEQAV